jgi:hypothetical protein
MADFVMSPVTVEFQNATQTADMVTVAIGTNPVGGTLLGSVTISAAGGVATFSNLRLDKPGSGYTLVAYANAPVNFATSSPFDVTPPSPPVATVTVTPGNVDAIAGNQVSFAATILDAAGNALTGRWVTWAVNGPAMLMGDGVACGLDWGAVTITATSEGKTGSALMNVTGTSSGVCCEVGC